jgi:hypothetical protein
MEININYWAVIVAAVASMAVGFVWYGMLFRKQWMELMGYTVESMGQMRMSANKAYILQFIASLVMAYVLAHSLIFASAYTGTTGAAAGMTVGFWSWLGFVAPITLGIVLWENKPWKLWVINASHYLVVLMIMGIILALWQ